MIFQRNRKSNVVEISTEAGAESIRRMDQAMNRRRFLTGAGAAGAVAGVSLITGCGTDKKAMAVPPTTADTAAQIFTAALIAEGLATTMYYNALVGGVIQDPNLAGTGGTALNISASGSATNVGYLRGALSEEIQHANLLRGVLGLADSTKDPIQTFYFPTGTFDSLANFFPVLVALETAFIAAYMTAVQEFGLMLGDVAPYSSAQKAADGTLYTAAELADFAKISAAILGVEAEHRTLARAIPSGTSFGGVQILPSDDVCYESTDMLTSVYNGSASAAAALGPFLAAGAKMTAFSYQAALSGSAAVQLACIGSAPTS